MGNEVPGHIEGGQLNAVGVVLDRRKDPGGNALGGLAQVIAREHPVDVGVVHGPEPAANVDGGAVAAGDHQNTLSLCDAALAFDLFERFHKLGADVELLDLVAPGGAHDTGGLFLPAEVVAVDVHAVPVGRGQLEQQFLTHL